MSHFPPSLLHYFEPRSPLPPCAPSTRKIRAKYDTVSSVMDRVRALQPLPPPKTELTAEQIAANGHEEHRRSNSRHIERLRSAYHPHDRTGADVTADAYKTLFVSRLPYDLTSADVANEFSYYGAITQCRVVTDRSGKSRGFAFIEFESAKDMTAAYRDADGRRIGDRRITVDVERGRTVKGWLPRRLGGGLGSTRAGAPDICRPGGGRDHSKLPNAQPTMATATATATIGAAANDKRAREDDRPSARRGDDRNGGGARFEQSSRRRRYDSRSRSRSPRRSSRSHTRSRSPRPRGRTHIPPSMPPPIPMHNNAHYSRAVR